MFKKDPYKYGQNVSYAKKTRLRHAYVDCMDLGCQGFGDDVQPLRKDHPQGDQKGLGFGVSCTSVV